MVVKPFTVLARQSLAKFSHGYAQSLVAASQSSYASTQTPLGHFGNHRVNRPASISVRDAFHASNLHTKAPRVPEHIQSPPATAPLEHYLAAWQSHQNEGGEWTQYEFTKTIGYEKQAAGEAVEATKQAEPELPPADLSVDGSAETLPTQTLSPRPGLGIRRAISGTIGEDLVQILKQAVTQAAKEANASVASPAPVVIVAPSTAEVSVEENVAGDSVIDTKRALPVDDESSLVSLQDERIFSAAATPKAVSVPESATPDSLRAGQALLESAEAGEFSEIPSRFRELVEQGSSPSIDAYNALLLAAINLPADSAKAIETSLSVYSDLLRNKVKPNAKTCMLLVQALSVRAIEIADAMKRLETLSERYRLPTGTLFQSMAVDMAILQEDSSLRHAMAVFEAAVHGDPPVRLSSATYNILVQACARLGNIAGMLQVYSALEENRITPHADVFPAILSALAKSQDEANVRHFYETYRQLAIADNSQLFAINGRADVQVEAALLKAFFDLGRLEVAESFIAKFKTGVLAVELSETQAQYLLQQKTLSWSTHIQSMTLSPSSALRLTRAAADMSNTVAATDLFSRLSKGTIEHKLAIPALIAMHVRANALQEASALIEQASVMNIFNDEMLFATTMFAAESLSTPFALQALEFARQQFSVHRAATTTQNLESTIDEAVEILVAKLTQVDVSSQAKVAGITLMLENGGLVPQASSNLLNTIDPTALTTLSTPDLLVLIRAAAGILCQEAQLLRLVDLVDGSIEICLERGIRFENDLVRSIRQAYAKVPGAKSIERFEQHVGAMQMETRRPREASLARTDLSHGHDLHDPTCDHQGSIFIIEALDRDGSRASADLNDALIRFRNIRKAGRHPRHLAYSKLITAAAKEKRYGLVHEIASTAQQDVPLVHDSAASVHGWILIWDALVAAHLNLGNRELAESVHQLLLSVGAAPSANTFGIYITTLASNSKTFDEASAAVKIYHRSQREGVEPTSFLFNALIGKLGKARRIDDCLFYFGEMRKRGIRPTSVTYGTMINALCRVSDDAFAVTFFDEMEAMPNYKPRPAPYNSMMQFYLNTKRDSSKVLEYYKRMLSRQIQPTSHTYKLLIDTHATLEPVNMRAAESVLEMMRARGISPEAVHYASLIHARGCVLHDLDGAIQLYKQVMADSSISPNACIFQALFESIVANHAISTQSEEPLADMRRSRIALTPYIANTLIHGWSMERDIARAKAVFDSLPLEKREPSTYEAMTRAFLSVQDLTNARAIVNEMSSRGYPSAVESKVIELLEHASTMHTPALL